MHVCGDTPPRPPPSVVLQTGKKEKEKKKKEKRKRKKMKRKRNSFWNFVFRCGLNLTFHSIKKSIKKKKKKKKKKRNSFWNFVFRSGLNLTFHSINEGSEWALERVTWTQNLWALVNSLRSLTPQTLEDWFCFRFQRFSALTLTVFHSSAHWLVGSSESAASSSSTPSIGNR